ncbi:hypothetical protein B0T11DRAFT_271966 [Plectosphaerella cucumerina]|jgi:hypothetical protein|uniref:Uncharacterized protein n=1 Tax=Plectosphaerella cucumerina TaxID=40658 RepID=A0A8K0TQJ8_9PEZI|nr:hypothetical protein B0T11DRAFT_271966 [Plectosphaerella cucumerina]
MAFDQGEFIRLLTDYYEFCRRVYCQDCPISCSPPGGWPEITIEALAGLQKNEDALNMIRSLPYQEISRNPENSVLTPHLLHETPIVDYRLSYVHDAINSDELEIKPQPFTDRDPPLPASCVCIPTTLTSNGYSVVVDTEDGYVYWTDAQGKHDKPAPELNKTLERFDDDEANQWRYYGTNVHTPADFFELCKQRWREMRWIALEPDHISAVPMYIASDSFDFVPGHDVKARLLRQVGWPGNGDGRDWDRERFLALVKEANP